MGRETQDRTADTFIFKPRGSGRFSGAAFLVLWLCAWALGEAFALTILLHGLWALLTGGPAFGTDTPLQMAPALGTGAFLLFWLAIWTVGGVMAISELFRLVWAEDRLRLDRDALWRMRRRGPFRATRAMARNEIQRLFIHPSNTALMVQLGANLIELTDLGTPADRADAARSLSAAMELPGEGTSAEPAALPTDWQEAAGTQGERLLVPNLRIRRQRAVALGIVTGIVWTALALLARESLTDPNLWVVTLMLILPAAWLARQTLWLFRGRNEWRIQRGRLMYQRRFGEAVTELYQARALELTESRDSDNDAWFSLHAIELSASPFTNAGKTPPKVKVMHSIHDPTVISHPDPQTTGAFRETSPTGDFHFRCVNAGSAERGFPGRFTGVHPCGRPGTIASPSSK